MSVEQRTVIEFGGDGKQTQHWVPPHDKVRMVDGVPYVSLGYSGDRGFARFIGGDMGASNPLKDFTWLDEALKLRNNAVINALEEIAASKIPGHVPGTAHLKRRALAEFFARYAWGSVSSNYARRSVARRI